MRWMVAAAAALVMAAGALGGARQQAAPARAQEAAYVVTEGNLFLPGTITVAAGTAVVWVNQEPDPANSHNVFSYQRLFESPDFYPGESWSMLFDTPGTYTYYCAYHEGMEGTVIVQ